MNAIAELLEKHRSLLQGTRMETEASLRSVESRLRIKLPATSGGFCCRVGMVQRTQFPTSSVRFALLRDFVLPLASLSNMSSSMTATTQAQCYWTQHLPTGLSFGSTLMPFPRLERAPSLPVKLTNSPALSPGLSTASRARQMKLRPNPPVEWDRREAALLGSLRGFAAPAAPHLARYASEGASCCAQ